MKKSNIDYTLYLVTDREILGNRNLEDAVEEAILGGVTLVQLREKNCSSLEFYNTAKNIKEITRKYNIPLIINDRLDIAQAIDADGVHIGQEDMPVDLARKILGQHKVIGVSAQTLEQALIAEEEGADYLGVGAIFNTTTKRDAIQDMGLKILKDIKVKVNIPIVGIGGIDHSNAKSVIQTGADGVAVVSCILKETDIRNSSKRLYDIVKK
ncbi:thiamine phosphate synthase [Hathewaya limosa]|uniref:Thiamine-phosphate synthase n=1 Tax=Hathewaya limosa TaxID=1536 RepID=A0ABU0JWB7_HATLI|nr:thiamine phosphate synthase [Hathewaya limosa]MDQ0480458.1 thiamine-phosphate pyrophosphorylase [Hathewaya limosa]